MRTRYFLLCISWLLSQFALAQSGGFPSRPTFQQLQISNTLPTLYITDSDASSNTKVQRFQTTNTNNTRALCNDAKSSCTNFENAIRTGGTNTVDSLTWTATDINALGIFSAFGDQVEFGGALTNYQIQFQNQSAPTANRASKLNINSSAGTITRELCDNALSSCTAYETIARTNNTATTITLTGTTINAAGTLQQSGVNVGVATLGTFTATETTGCTGTPTMTVGYTLTATEVIFTLGASSDFSCTTDSALSLTFSGVPSAIYSVIAPTLPSGRSTHFTCSENGTATFCDAILDTSGNMTVIKASTATNGGWTGTGAKLLTTAVLVFRRYN